MIARLGLIGWLIALSIMATIIHDVHHDAVRVYGMWGIFLQSQEWGKVAIQYLTFQFFHGGALHLFSNSFFLIFIGIGVQYAMGVRRFFYMFLFSTIFVGTILLFTAKAPTIGMSGFAMAVLAYYTTMLWSVKNEQYKSGLVLIAINIFIGLDPAISLGGHLWGAVAGVIYWFIDNRFFKRRYHIRAGWRR